MLFREHACRTHDCCERVLMLRGLEDNPPPFSETRCWLCETRSRPTCVMDEQQLAGNLNSDLRCRVVTVTKTTRGREGESVRDHKLPFGLLFGLLRTGFPAGGGYAFSSTLTAPYALHHDHDLRRSGYICLHFSSAYE